MKERLDIEKLRGLDNYHTWCFAVKIALSFRSYEKCIAATGTETDVNKLKNCKSLLCLSVETKLYVHIMNAENVPRLIRRLRFVVKFNSYKIM